MARSLFFIRHKPTGQWYCGKYGYSAEFLNAAIFHQHANALKQIKKEAAAWQIGTFHGLHVECEERMVEWPQSDGSVILESNWGHETIPITETTISDLEVVEFELVQKV